MNNSTDIILRPFENGLSFSGAIETQRDEAIGQAALVGKVNDPVSQQAAGAALKSLLTVMKLVNRAESELKKPLNEAKARIMDKCARFLAEPAAERDRLERLLADFEAAEKARVLSAQAAQVAELSEIEKAREGELALAKTLEERDDIHDKWDGLLREENKKKADSAQPTRAPGQVVGSNWKIVVHDPAQLYRHHPQCCKLTPIRSEIKALLDAGIRPFGVTAEKVTTVTMRTPKEPDAITL